MAGGYPGDDRSVRGIKDIKSLIGCGGNHLLPIKFCLGLVSHFATEGLIAVAERLAGAWPFPLAMRDTLSVRTLLRRRAVVVFIWLIWVSAVFLERFSSTRFLT